MSPEVAAAVVVTSLVAIPVGAYYSRLGRANRDIRDVSRVLRLRWRQFWIALFALAVIGFVLATMVYGAFKAWIGSP